MTILTKIKNWLVAAGLTVILLAAMWLHGRKEGKAAAEAEAQKKNLKAIRDARSVENEVQGMDGANITKRLDKWMRD